MPIYEYQCQSCRKVFEFMQRMSDDPMTECEECKGALERIISQSAFHLKGGGWYKDLYSSTKKDESGSSASSSDSSSSDSSSSGASTGAASSAKADTSASSTSSTEKSSTKSESKAAAAPSAAVPAKASTGSKD